MSICREFTTIQAFDEYLAKCRENGCRVTIFNIKQITFHGSIAVCIEENADDQRPVCSILKSARKKKKADRNFDEHIAILTNKVCGKNQSGEYDLSRTNRSSFKLIVKYCRNISHEDGERIIRYFYERSNYRKLDVEYFIVQMKRG